MITPDYCIAMARYNAWQNSGLRKVLLDRPEEDLDRERGAFFGSIRRTANHLLWADQMWMSRLVGGPKPQGGIAESVAICPIIGDWEAQRFRTDGRIREWARDLKTVDLVGDLTWYSGALGREVSKPKALCVVHMFNHQTHHRGQLHAMLTASGVDMPDTDLFMMPDDD